MWTEKQAVHVLWLLIMHFLCYLTGVINMLTYKEYLIDAFSSLDQSNQYS